ncbi:MAG TPA: shikimate kinase [Chthoniobacterales bacterium]|nr:shikimate kinase [Chthoniobacterales bacterium]
MKKHGHAIVLIGFIGAGKSSVGRTLARITGRPRFDTDQIIATRFGLTISQIFEKRGEESFRDAESEALEELSGETEAIIVTGGGIVLREANTARLRQLGSVVYLLADEETLFRRISRRPTRPLLQTTDPRTTMKELLRSRLPLYRAAADVEVDTSGLTHDEVARSILKRIEEHERSGVEPEG